MIDFCFTAALTARTVTVVSPNSYFSFTPFLASAAVGTLEYRCATEPVRGIKNIQFAQGWADKIGGCQVVWASWH